jgi:hypothetical protein
LQHLISNLDEDAPDQQPRCGGTTVVSGYTEWVSPVEPALSIGWDWQWRAGPGTGGMVRLGLPRTNILVVSEASVPLAWESSLEVLASLVDGMDWQRVALDAAFRPAASATYKN